MGGPMSWAEHGVSAPKESLLSASSSHFERFPLHASWYTRPYCMSMMQGSSRKNGGGSGGLGRFSWNLAAIFAFIQLAMISTIYKLYDIRAGVQAGGDLGAWAPSQQVDGHMRSVRLNETDEEYLRNKCISMLSTLPAAANPQRADWGEAAVTGRELGQEDLLPPSAPDVPRLVDESFGPNPSSNIPGVEDVYQELREYEKKLLTSWKTDAGAAAQSQARPDAAELSLRAVDPMQDVSSIPARVGFLNELADEVLARETLRLAIATTTSVDLLGIRQELLPWMQYHTELGVTKFYILYDGSDPAAVEALSSIRHCEVIHIHEPWASAMDRALYSAYLNATITWAGGVGNYELMCKQGFCEQEALQRARDAGLDWLMHLDPDELFHPGGHAASITAELSLQPAHVPAVRFLNFEGQPEFGNMQNRYEQVTLFRVHKHFITPEAFYYRGKYVLGGNKAFLYLYANGKSAVRVDAPGVTQSGPHYFQGFMSSRWAHPGNPTGSWHNAISDKSVILHYAYTRLSDVKDKARRSCPAKFAGENREVIRQSCFVIDFDADAYFAASKGDSAIEKFYFHRMVLSEGAPIRCHDPTRGRGDGWCTLSDVPRFTFLMEKIGLMRRFLLPQTLLRQHERAIRRRIGGIPCVKQDATL